MYQVVAFERLPQLEPNSSENPGAELGSQKLLSSDELRQLGRSFSDIAELFEAELFRLRQNGVTSSEEPTMKELTHIKIRLESVSGGCFSAAVVMLVVVELESFNNQLIASTKELLKAAENLKNIKDGIDLVVKAFDTVLDISEIIVSSQGSVKIPLILSEVQELINTATSA